MKASLGQMDAPDSRGEEDEAVPWRAFGAVYLVAVLASIAVGSRGIAYWDAGDYVKLAIRGGTSGLLLGRPLFLAASRAMVRCVLAVGARPEHLEPTLRWAWTLASATAAPLLGWLAFELRLGRSASVVAGLCLAVAPSFAHTSHQVLTDGPALALSLAALAVTARARKDAHAIVAGTLLACAITTRETAAVHGVAMMASLWSNKRRMVLALGAGLLVTFLVVLVSHGGTLSALRGWFSAMHRSSSSHPLTLRDVGMSLVWLLSLGPLPVLLGALGLPRVRERDARLRKVIVPAAIATGLLFLYPDGSFSPRYFLAVAPIGLFLCAAPGMARWLTGRARWAVAVSLALPLALSPLFTRKPDAIAEVGRALPARLAQLGDGTVLVPGHFCPAVGAWLAAERASDRLSLVCPGWDWPGDAAAVARKLDGERCLGHAVALALSEDAWVGAREVEARDAVRAYAAHERSSSAGGFTVLAPLAANDARCAGRAPL